MTRQPTSTEAARASVLARRIGQMAGIARVAPELGPGRPGERRFAVDGHEMIVEAGNVDRAGASYGGRRIAAALDSIAPLKAEMVIITDHLSVAKYRDRVAIGQDGERTFEAGIHLRNLKAHAVGGDSGKLFRCCAEKGAPKTDHG